MGKRKKSNLQINTIECKIAKVDNKTTDEAEIQINSKNKKIKSKKKNKVDLVEETVFIDHEVNITESNSVIIESHTNSKKKLKTKCKKKNDTDEDNSSLLNNDSVIQTVETRPPDNPQSHEEKKVKNKKNKASREGHFSFTLPEKNKNNLITVEQDQVVEIATSIQKKGMKSDLQQEDDVKDEDIDKFCDEIDEEDNQQYLNWVELLEAKLNPNKKKPK